jgi:D-alanyl-D-alanine carboxypeptidase
MFVKKSVILLLSVTLFACMRFSLPEGISFRGEQEGQDNKQSEHK